MLWEDVSTAQPALWIDLITTSIFEVSVSFLEACFQNLLQFDYSRVLCLLLKCDS